MRALRLFGVALALFASNAGAITVGKYYATEAFTKLSTSQAVAFFDNTDSALDGELAVTVDNVRVTFDLMALHAQWKKVLYTYSTPMSASYSLYKAVFPLVGAPGFPKSTAQKSILQFTCKLRVDGGELRFYSHNVDYGPAYGGQGWGAKWERLAAGKVTFTDSRYLNEYDGRNIEQKNAIATLWNQYKAEECFFGENITAWARTDGGYQNESIAAVVRSAGYAWMGDQSVVPQGITYQNLPSAPDVECTPEVCKPSTPPPPPGAGGGAGGGLPPTEGSRCGDRDGVSFVEGAISRMFESCQNWAEQFGNLRGELSNKVPFNYLQYIPSSDDGFSTVEDIRILDGVCIFDQCTQGINLNQTTPGIWWHEWMRPLLFYIFLIGVVMSFVRQAMK